MILVLEHLGEFLVHGMSTLDAFVPISASSGGKQRFRKDIMRVGEFVKQSEDLKFEVTHESLQHWVKTFGEMKKNGIKVSIPNQHKNHGNPQENKGWVEDLFIDDDRLVMTCEIIDENAADLVRKADVSIFSPPRFVDGEGREYVQPIRHVALCTDPVIPGLGDFIPIAASHSEGDSLMLDQIKAWAKELGIKDEVTKENADTILTKIRKMSSKKEEPKKEEPKKEEPKKVAASLGDDKPHPQLVKLTGDNRKMRLDALVAAKRITPAVRDKFAATWCDSKAIELSLSSGDDGSSFTAMVDALMENDPVELRETTGPQDTLLLSDPYKDKGSNVLLADADRRRKAIGLAT